MQSLSNVSYWLDLLPVLVFLFFVKKIREKPIWAIFIYSIYSFVNNSFVFYNIKHKIDYSKFYYTFTLFEYLLFVTMLFFIIKSNIVKKLIIPISIFFTFFCAYYILASKIDGFDSIQTAVECILIIILCLFYFYEQLISQEVALIYNNYKFWIVIALLLYLAGAFFIFVFAASMPKKEADSYWAIIFIGAIIRNILFTIAVYLSTRPQDEEPYQSLI